MSAWVLAVSLCLPASAQVVETRVARPSSPGVSAGVSRPIPALPPSLMTLPLGLGESPLQPQMRFAPPAATPGAAAVESTPSAEPVPGRAAPKRDAMPPSTNMASRATPHVALFRDSEKAAAVADPALARTRGGPAALRAAPAESAAAVGRRVWDQSSEKSSLGEGAIVAAAPAAMTPAFTAVPGARDAWTAESAGAAESEALRDAVAAPAGFPPSSVRLLPRLAAGSSAPLAPPAVRARGTSPRAIPAESATVSAAPFDRLSLELASGLVVRVRAALGIDPPGRSASLVRPRAAVPAGAAARVPLTSTEWLERRGLFEALSASESAAGDVVSAPDAAREDRILPFSSAAPSSAPSRQPPVPLISLLWGLAFLPAAAALRELL